MEMATKRPRKTMNYKEFDSFGKTKRNLIEIIRVSIAVLLHELYDIGIYI